MTTSEQPDVPRLGNADEQQRLGASERLLSACDFKDSQLMQRSRSDDSALSYLPPVEVGDTNSRTRDDTTTFTYTSAREGRIHQIEYDKSGGEIQEVRVGGAKWEKTAEGWRGPDGQSADHVEIKGEGKDTRVFIKQGDKSTMIRADGSTTVGRDGPNGSEHIVVRNSEGMLSEVIHNGQRFQVGADGRVSSPGAFRGSAVNGEGEIVRKIGDAELKLKADGTTEVKNGAFTTTGYGDGSRVYMKDDVVIGVRDAQRNKIVFAPDGTATVSNGKAEVPGHPLHGKRVEGSGNPPVLVDKDNPGNRYHLDGRRVTVEEGRDGRKGATSLTDGKANEVTVSYKPPESRDQSKISEVNAGKYGKLEVGAGRDQARQIRIDPEKGTVTADMNDGSKVTINLSDRTRTVTKGNEVRKTNVDGSYTEVTRDGKLTKLIQGDLNWIVTDARNGTVTSVENKHQKFEMGKNGVNHIKVNNGVITVTKMDGAIHSFRPDGNVEIKRPVENGQPECTVKMKLDGQGRPTEINDGSTANGGKGNTYRIEWTPSGKIGNVSINGEAFKPPAGTQVKDFALDSKGRIVAELKDGKGKLTFDPERQTKTTDLPGQRIVEGPRGKVEYALNADGKAAAAKIFATGADKPTFTALLGADGKVTEVFNAEGLSIGKARPGVEITLDEAGPLKVKLSADGGRAQTEITINPDKSGSIKIGNESKSYTPEHFPSSIQRPGGTAQFDYCRDEKGRLSMMPAENAPGRSSDMAVPARVKFGNGYALERVGGDDITNLTPGKDKFVLMKDGKPLNDAGGKPVEFENACVDRAGNTYLKDASGNWHKVSPEGRTAGTIGPNGRPGGLNDRLPIPPARPPGDGRPPQMPAASDSPLPPGDLEQPGQARGPWTADELRGTRPERGRPHILTRYDPSTGITTQFDLRRNVKTEIEHDRNGYAKTATETRINPTTGEWESETWRRVAPGTELSFPYRDRMAGRDTWVSDRTATVIHDGRNISAPIYRDNAGLDRARDHHSNFRPGLPLRLPPNRVYRRF